jgi:hypothetical protein
MLGRIIIGWLIWLVFRAYTLITRAPHCTFTDPETGEAYLTRWWLGARDAWPDPDGRTGVQGLYLHHFHRSDWSRNLHNHPSDGAALILVDGYRETRKDDGGPVYHVERRPCDVNVITSKTFHRVELMNERRGSWSLFYIGPRLGKWGFIQADGSVERAAHFDGRTGQSTART